MMTPRMKPFLTVTAALVFLAGCQTSNWTNVRPTPAPVVQAVSYIHLVQFTPENAELNGDEKIAIETFMTRANPGQRDRVELAARLDMVGASRLATIKAALSRWPVPVYVTDAEPAQMPDDVRVTLTTHVVTLPRCPDWTRHPSVNFDNTPSSNFGCANARNFGLMVAEPADLLEIGRAHV